MMRRSLIEVPRRRTTGELWTAFREAQRNIAGSTLECYDHARRRFFHFFRADEVLSELSTPRMEQWKQCLRNEGGLAESTVAVTITKAKAVFNWAVRVGWIEQSPLDGVRCGSFVNRMKDRFVTMDEYHRLLNAAPCADWRVMITLVRIGGLRAPSEVLQLRWIDIDWKRSRLYVESPKTRRYTGREGRVIPLFPQLRVELEGLFGNEAGAEAEYVINRYRDPARTNLGTQFARIAKMAEVEPIQRPFDNMRASRSTEMFAEYGAYLESKWIGHRYSLKKEIGHCLRVNEEDFERAAGMRPSEAIDTAEHSDPDDM